MIQLYLVAMQVQRYIILDSNYMNDVWVFNTITLEWKLQQVFGNVPEARSNATLNYDKQHNQLILFGGGGLGKKRFNCIYTLDWDTKKWTQIQPKTYENVPWQRTYHISQIIGNYLVIFGGQNFADLNDLWLFDLEENKWQQANIPSEALKPCPRRFHTSVLRKNQLIIIGGCHNKYRSLKDIFKMNFDDFLKTKNSNYLKWEQVIIQSSDFIPRWGHSSTYNMLNDKIYIFGGRFSNDLQDILTLDIEKGTSKKMSVHNEDSPCPRRRHSANFIGSSLIIFGGFNGSYFNDSYSISFPLENGLPKYAKQSIIQFSQHFKKQPQFTVSFLSTFIKQFQILSQYLKQKFTIQQSNQILTSIVRGYWNGTHEKYQQLIQYFQKQKILTEGTKFFGSKQLKIQNTRNSYARCHVLQEKRSISQAEECWTQRKLAQFKNQHCILTQSKQNCIKNNQANQNSPQYSPQSSHFLSIASNQDNFTLSKYSHESSTFSEIILLNQEQFGMYLKSNNKNILEFDSKMEDYFCYFIEICQIGLLKLDRIAKYTSSYFQHCFKNNGTLTLSLLDQKLLRVIQVGFLFVQTSVLAVPKNFTFQQWKYLAEFANYFCLSTLNKIVEKFLISKVDFKNISQLSSLACAMKMQNLIKKCSSTIIERQQKEFFLDNATKTKINSQLFVQFEQKFFTTFSNFIYPQQFQIQLTYQFEVSKLNIFLRNLKKLRQFQNSSEKNKAMMELENEEKQNQQNTVSSSILF